jgi:hypothetical protein
MVRLWHLDWLKFKHKNWKKLEIMGTNIIKKRPRQGGTGIRMPDQYLVGWFPLCLVIIFLEMLQLVMCWLGLAWKLPARLGFSGLQPSKTEAWAVLVGLGRLRLGLDLSRSLWEKCHVRFTHDKKKLPLFQLVSSKFPGCLVFGNTVVNTCFWYLWHFFLANYDALSPRWHQPFRKHDTWRGGFFLFHLDSYMYIVMVLIYIYFV